MKRRLILFGLCLALVFGLFAIPAAADQPDWVTAYEQVLDGWKQQIASESAEYGAPELWYLAYDVDKDGTPELIVKTGTCEADYHGALYTFRGGQAVQVGDELGLGHSSFYTDPGENGVILMYGHMGYASASRLRMTDGLIEEPLYEDNLNERLQQDENAEYVYPGDVIPGSVYLTLCRGELNIGLTHYEGIMRCLEGIFPPQQGSFYPKGKADFYDSLMASNGTVYAVTADGFTKSPGPIGFQDLLKKDAAVNWMDGDLRVLSATPADCNGDGKLEYVLALDNGGSELRCVLSEQDGTVYAYLMNYTEGYALDADGNFITTLYGTARYRLIFDGPEAFMLYLP